MKKTLSICAILFGIILSLTAQDMDEIGDQRHIKTAEAIQDDEALKDAILSVPIYTVTYRDSFSNYSGQQMKTIAQDLEENLPSAVTTDTGYVPDVFALPTSFNYDATALTCEFEMDADHGLNEGEKIKILDGEKAYHVEVQEVSNYQTFIVNLIYEPQKPFIYGRWVDDLKLVDYESLVGLNIATTQQLIKDLEAMNERLKRVEELLSKVIGGSD